MDLPPTVQWRHNECDGVPNHQPRHCLLNRLFRWNQRKHQSFASLAFVREIHRWPVNSPHKWPVTRKMFPFDDVIMKVWNMIFAKLTRRGDVGQNSESSWRIHRCQHSHKCLRPSWSSPFESCEEPYIYHDRMDTFSSSLTFCEGNPLIASGRPEMENFDFSFLVSQKRLLNKQPNFRWFETPWRSSNVRPTMDQHILTIESIPADVLEPNGAIPSRTFK